MPEERENQLEQPFEDVRPGDTVTGHVAKHDFMLSNTVQIGKIVAPEEGDPPKPATGAFVLVQIGGEEPKTYTRNWMPWLARRAGLDAEWWKPDVDEQVLVLAPSGNLALGVVAGSIYRGARVYFPDGTDLSQSLTDGSRPEHLPPECGNHTEADLTKHTSHSAEHVHRQIYRDGTTMEYDSVLHALTYDIKRKQQDEYPSVSLNAALEENKGSVSISLREPTAKQPILSLKATLEEKNGEVLLALGDKTSLSAGLTDEKGGVDITIDKTTIQVTDESVKITDPTGNSLEMTKDAFKITSKVDFTIDASGQAVTISANTIDFNKA